MADDNASDFLDGSRELQVRHAIMRHVRHNLRIVDPAATGAVQPEEPVVVHGIAIGRIEQPDAFKTRARRQHSRMADGGPTAMYHFGVSRIALVAK